eukprot:jgi/Ulvmu1/10911/UM007_0088.1
MSTALPETYHDLFGEEVEWQPNRPVTFWFARHGQSEYNVEDRIGGDSSITAKGQRFADALPGLFGRVLRDVGEDPRFITVWTSTLLRTIQTASKLPLPQVHLSELDEIHAGVCDGATYPYIKTYMPYVHYSRKRDKLHYRYPSGESYIDLCRRTWPVLQRLKRHGGSRLIVGHQAVLRCLFGYLEGRKLDDITHLSVPHHQIFQFTVYPDGKIERRDFPMELVTEAPEGPVAMQWPFDVSHSRPLTVSDVARAAPRPKVPLLLNRTASLADVLAPAAADAAAAAAAPDCSDAAAGGSGVTGGEVTHRTVERNVSLAAAASATVEGLLVGDATTPRLCQSVPRELALLHARGGLSAPPAALTHAFSWTALNSNSALNGTDDDASEAAQPPQAPLSSPQRPEGGEGGPTFAYSIPEKCCSVHASATGLPGLRPMDSCGTLSSLIGSKAVQRPDATNSSTENQVPVAGPQVTCPACGACFMHGHAAAPSLPRADSAADVGAASQQASQQLSSAFEMDDCAAELGSALTVSASAVGDWSGLDNYPGSPCAPYPLIAGGSTPGTKDDLAAAFIELRTGSKRVSLDEAAGSFVADDPRVHAEAQRRRVEDEHGFHFRRGVCVLLETSAHSTAAAPEPEAEDDVLRPAELAW